jgi:anion-transporting  ArsA/GET3 family ATPase
MSITSQAAIEDYVVQQIKFRKLYRMVFRNRVMGPFLDAVPGLHDLIQLGKVFDLERERSYGKPAWDLLVIDAPATGHGLTMLASPRAMMDLTVAGPFHENARDVAALYEDPARVGLVLVSLPEELPVNETLELYGRLGPMQGQVRAVMLNEVFPPPVPDPAWYAAHRDALAAAADPAGVEALALADDALLRQAAEARARARLREIGAPVLDIGFRMRRDLGPDDIAAIAGALP